MLKSFEMKRAAVLVLFLKISFVPAQTDGTFLIYNVHKNRCLGDDLQRLDLCDPQNLTQQFRWTSEQSILNVAQKKCLGTESMSKGTKLQWFICDPNTDLQKWECRRKSLFGLKNESLYLSIQGDSNLTLSRDPGDEGQWTIHGTMDSVCSRPYEEIYTLKGNAFGRPCHFPFLFNDEWYANCTTEGRSSKQPWCAVEREYKPNELWGYCPSHQKAGEFWTRSPVSDVYYQVNEESALTWTQARKSCEQQGGDLLSITEPHQQVFMSGLINNTGTALWMGLNSLAARRGWHWINGQPFRYLKWHSGEPSSEPGHNCGMISQLDDSEWSTAVCSERRGYICQSGLSSPTLPPDVLTGYCPSLWTPYSGHCYHLSGTKRTWLEARDACRREGGDLLSVLSVEEQSFIISRFGFSKTDELWIGLNDLKTPMLFEWSDHSNVSFTLWDVNEPSHSAVLKEDCVLMRGEEGKWADHICENKHGYICKNSSHSDSSTPIPNTGCRPLWIRYGSSCYLTGSETKTFEEARQTCENTGSYLTDVTDSLENAFLVSLIGSRTEKHFWIGLSNQKEQTTFEWVDVKDVFFTNFNEGMPGGKQGCVAMTTGVFAGLWDVLNCTNAEKYICKQRAEGVTTTPAPSTTPALDCSDGWSPVANRNLCFKLFQVEHNQQKMWSEALDFCRELGGDLLSLHGAEDISEEYRTYYPVYAWIGYSIQDPSAGYTWSDGSPSSYESWEDEEPNNFSNMENCVKLTFQTGRQNEIWNDEQCDDTENWYCEIQKGVTPKEVEVTVKTYETTHDGWIVFKDYQYYIHKGLDVPMVEARRFCKHRHGDLVSINDEKERVFLWQQIKRQYAFFYIGLNIDLDKSLSWMDGSPLVFEAWSQNQPAFQNSDEHCVKMSWSQGLWHSVNCGDDENFICKRSGSVPFNATVVPTEPPTGGCAPDWVKFQEKCYKIGLDLKTWTEARSYCRSLGGNLASINNRLQQVFLTSRMDDANTPDLWHGLNNLIENRLRWTDGSPILFTHWGKSADDNIRMDYVYRREYLIHSTPRVCGIMEGERREALGKWFMINCDDTAGYICSQSVDHLIEPISTKVPDTFIKLGNSSYMLLQTNLTWQEAQHHCEAEGSNLASVRDLLTQSYIELQIYKLRQPLWIGLNDLEMPGFFQWIDKWQMNMEMWARDEPKRDCPCVYVDEDGTWKSAQCNQTHYSVCKKSTDVAPTPPAHYLGVCPEETEDEPRITWVPYKGHCYAFVKTAVPWNTASQMCMEKGANLVSILDPTEAKFLETYLRLYGNDDRNFWIGIFKNLAGHWLWVDRSVMNFKNLVQLYSDHEFGHFRDFEATLDCAIITAHDTDWNKRRCEENYPFICKIAKVIPPPTKMPSTGNTEAHGPFNGVSVIVVVVLVCVVAAVVYLYHRRTKH